MMALFLEIAFMIGVVVWMFITQKIIYTMHKDVVKMQGEMDRVFDRFFPEIERRKKND